MSTKQDGETKTVLRNLLILLLIFYFSMYIVCLISAAALGEFGEGGSFSGETGWFNAGYLPFWHSDCGVGEGDLALAVWLGQVLAQVALLAAIFLIVRSTLHAWDYSVTVSFLHFCLTCVVTQSAPATWQWWVTTVVCTLLVSVASELMCYFLIDLREIEKN
mmetsp:Transcript_33468/g.85802  ORF Transcript_33468/g.85802 Transcript_33468/m.85802 type:complete len:162 (-) Transcript_33468:73-558(-)|eukprot:CAMPEP_0174918032 /NCGR_PEP_ID=MMETSP1355-20121228/2851_1 /TAXON_ID=464990 /ORGANISM="Hemiselmis tepida, Strain CCMP443" /LENGTH=161 /DNA_ID=CAMNT_0016163189 /DNA_START=388 /DNA_END=873 /DNA_ORIENTATION=+